MNDEQIEALRRCVKNSVVYWIPDQSTAHPVIRVGPPPPPEEGDVPEPSDCAYLANGKYIALYNTSLPEFCQVKRIEPPNQ